MYIKINKCWRSIPKVPGTHCSKKMLFLAQSDDEVALPRIFFTSCVEVGVGQVVTFSILLGSEATTSIDIV